SQRPRQGLRCRLPASLGLFQGALLLFFALFVSYDEHTDAASQAVDTDPGANQLYGVFPFFQDVQVMLAVALGLLLAFMPRYGLGALAYNFLLLNFSTQWALALQGLLYHFHHGKVHLGLRNVLTAEFAAVTVLISVGAVLGRTSPFQLLLAAFCEIPVYLASEWAIITWLKVLDVGGTITIHVFSCYFGLGMSKALFRPGKQLGHPKENPTYQSDLLSLAGMLSLWVFWPSFVAALCQPGDAQHRAVLHTILALSASVLTTFLASGPLESRGKLSLGHLQNASLAGGVAIGALADMMITPAAALALGSLSSLACVLGFKFLAPFLARRLGLLDQCGIHNLHGLPGLIGAVAGVVAILVASEETYGHRFYQVFPARGPPGGNSSLAGSWPEVMPGRSASEQALFQAAGLAVAIGGSLLGGFLTGTLLRLPGLAQPPQELCFDDALYFKIPDPAETSEPDNPAEEAHLALKERV
uniref:Ammonium transporter AmtB-like domain-containing protein n=1 Tax=Apteryx owenii TaxID=8824 RepID=A0A8B9NYE1_APTOW